MLKALFGKKKKKVDADKQKELDAKKQALDSQKAIESLQKAIDSNETKMVMLEEKKDNKRKVI